MEAQKTSDNHSNFKQKQQYWVYYHIWTQVTLKNNSNTKSTT